LKRPEDHSVLRGAREDELGVVLERAVERRTRAGRELVWPDRTELRDADRRHDSFVP
jgi:hypothetical protein